MNIATIKHFIQYTFYSLSMFQKCPDCQGMLPSRHACNVCNGKGMLSEKDMVMFNDVISRIALIQRNKDRNLNALRKQLKKIDDKKKKQIDKANKTECSTKDMKKNIKSELFSKTSAIQNLELSLKDKDDVFHANISLLSDDNVRDYNVLRASVICFIKRKRLTFNCFLSQIDNIPRVMTAEAIFKTTIDFRTRFMREDESIKNALNSLCGYKF